MWPISKQQQRRVQDPPSRPLNSKSLPHSPRGESTSRSPLPEHSHQSRSQQAVRVSPKQQKHTTQQDQSDSYVPKPRPLSRGNGSSSARRANEASADVVNVHGVREDSQDHEAHRSEDIIRQLKIDLGEALANQQDLRQEVLCLQEERFKKMVDPRFAPPKDSVIQHELSEIQNDITRIGKRFVGTHIGGLDGRTDEELTELYSELEKVALLQKPLPAAVREELTQTKSFGRLCFTGVLSWHVHQEVFKNPFFFMKEKTEGMDWSLVFSEMEQLASKVDPAQASNWRSQTLQYFLPEQNSDLAASVRECTATLTRKASEVAARAFLNSPAIFLAHGLKLEECEALSTEITGVYERAATFSMLLWCRRLALRISSFADLASVKFRVDSPEVKAHPLHILDDPIDRRLDGRAIRIMVHPFVAGFDTRDTDNAQTVFVRATVCLAEGN